MAKTRNYEDERMRRLASLDIDQLMQLEGIRTASFREELFSDTPTAVIDLFSYSHSDYKVTQPKRRKTKRK